MNSKVAIVDYGIGNVFSVGRALEHCGAEAYLTAEPAKIEAADYLILPGVGAFADAMKGLREKNLLDAVKNFCLRDRPFMGICLGMQMMLDSTEEFGHHEGIGLISGRVEAIPDRDATGNRHKLPHIGWNRLIFNEGSSEDKLLSGVESGSYVYFVHSFSASPADQERRIADTEYNGCRISAIIKLGNLYGCQFHPEKSGKVGLNLITNFISL